MKRTLIIIAAIAVVVLGCVAAIWLKARSNDPNVLLGKLAAGSGDRDEIIMKLNVNRKDTVEPMIAALNDTAKPPRFRGEVVEMLAKLLARTADSKIERALIAATKDSQAEVRIQAARCLATYAPISTQVALLDLVDDDDPEVRREVYLLLAARARAWQNKIGIWAEISDEQRAEMIQRVVAQVPKETDPEMKLLARSVLGREIEIRGAEARQAQQTSDLAQAEEIFRGALALDPGNRQGQILLVRYLLETGDKQEALAQARKYGALIEIPELSVAPEIDGDPTDDVWSQAYFSDRFYLVNSRWFGKDAEGRSAAYVGHKDGTLYIAMIGYEDEIDRLVMGHVGRDTEVWRDDCVELIFDPQITGQRMYQFVINPGGGLYDQANEDEGKNFECEYAAQVFTGRKYWACEFAIEGEKMDNNTIRPGAMWALNLYRTRIGPASEQCGLWPTFGYSKRMEVFPLALFLGDESAATESPASQPATAPTGQ